MKEVVYDFSEFKAKVDLSRPVHHHGFKKCIDGQGIFFRLEFHLEEISKDGGHVVCYYAQKRTTIAESEQDMKWYNKMVDSYAKPLGSTEGEWRE
jgi:hypothetical protein